MSKKINQTISQNELSINQNERVAIIYSIDDVSYYTVEIRFEGESYFIKHKKLPVTYASINEAKKAARSHKAVTGYMALSSTYQEVGVSLLDTDVKRARYDYMKIDLATS